MHVQLVSIILGNFFLESIILKFSYSSIIQHEMMHALGLFHMQSRPDRDSYVKINSANIQSGTEGNFEKCDTCLTYEVGYDARSFMHYHSTAFSTNGQPTIESIVSQLCHFKGSRYASAYSFGFLLPSLPWAPFVNFQNLTV